MVRLGRWSVRALIVCCTLFAMISCGGTEQGSKDAVVNEIDYNALVESFTTGNIGRKANVSVTLTEAINSDVKLDKYIEISPKIKGSWVVSESRRRLVFKPESEFERGVIYNVEIDFKELFPGNKTAEEFEFSFRTLPADASAELTSFTIEPDDSYTMKGVLLTSDFEDSTQVRKMTKWDGTGDDSGKKVQWTHSADGKQHNFVVENVKIKKSSNKVTLTIDDDKSGYDKKQVLNVSIPAKGSFEVHSVEYVANDERYIEVTFTQRLDAEQDVDGLIWLEIVDNDIEQPVRQIDGNVVKIYVDALGIIYDDNGEASITVCVSKSLKSEAKINIGNSSRHIIKIDKGDPKVRFLGKGTIVPSSSAMVSSGGSRSQGIPFQAIGLRAVKVEVFRILEISMGYFLQENELSDENTGNIMRTSRPVASKTIFLDEGGVKKLNTWNTYSLNLDELVKPEEGALYRISLSFDRSMASLPCVAEEERLTPQVAKANDEAEFNSMLKRFDKGGGYYSGRDNDYSYYDWSERKDPCTPSYYYNKTVSRNLLVTDLGLIAKASDESKMLLLVYSITTAEAIKDAKVELMNFQGQKIGEGVTDDQGEVMVDYDGGRPYYAMVSKDKQKTYLKVNSGAELSSSTFDVSGEQVQDGMRGFVWTERGVWRPGDTIYMNFLTAGTELPEGHPVTVELRSPLGQLYQKRVATKTVGGIYSFVLSTDAEAPTGVWNATVIAGGATFAKRLRVEAVKPNRLKIDLKFPNDIIQRGESLDATLHGEWLTGARAGGLKYIIETEFTAVRSSFDGYKGYMFDNSYLSFRAESAPDITGTIDAQGDARITAVINGGEKAGGMLQANITTRLFEPSGEASVDGVTMLYSPYSSYVGIKPPTGSDDRLDTDKDYTFEIVTVTPEGKQWIGRTVDIRVYKLSWSWWWSSERGELARYVSDRSLSPVQQTRVKSSTSGRVSYNMNISRGDWGRYYVTARDVNSGHESAVLVYMDWPDYGRRQNDSDSDGAGAMRLAVSLDKKSYNVGDKATVSFPSTEGSRAIISIENGSKVLEVFPVICSGGKMNYSFDVSPEMQPNVYLNVTLLQPYATVENDLPVRMYGIVPLVASSPESKLQPVLKCSDEVLPESEMKVTVSEENGKAFAYTLVIVDEGLLDLTRFRTPDPWKAFNARVALGVSTWDIYNDVLGAYGGKIEQMFAIGGDGELGSGPNATVNRFPPVVKYLGVFELEKGRKATHKIELPAYMGRVRVMAVAVSQSADQGNGAWGSAEKSVAVRAPLMVLGSAPRAVAPGDEVVVPATLIATQDGIGNATATIEVDENVFSIVGEAKQSVSLPKKGDRIVNFRLKVKEAIPVGSIGGRIEIKATSSGKGESRYVMEIPVRKLLLPVSRGRSYTVEAGKEWKGEMTLRGMPGTQSLMLDVSSMLPLNSSQRMEYLSTYPYGCIEQITSAVFPLLYLPYMADLSPNEQATADSKVRYVLNKYKNYATPDGSMGYWQGNTSPSTWGSAYALHFMTEALHKGYTPATGVYGRLKSAVKSMAVRWNASSNKSSNLVLAYQLYALSLAGEPEIGAMNRLRQSNQMTSETKWMLAAAYAVAGRVNVGKTLVAGEMETTSAAELRQQRRVTYGSSQRAQAAQLLSLSLLKIPNEATQLATIISRELASDEWMSTQTTAWCMMAMGAYMGHNGKVSKLEFDWSVGDESGEVESESNKIMMWSGEWKNPKSGKMSIENSTEGRLYIRAVSSGISSGRGVDAAANGIEVTVRYLDGAGTVLDISSLEQGTDFVSEVTVRNLGMESVTDLMLTQPVASGWEIRPDAATVSSSQGVGYRDIRDDRVDSYIEELDGNEKVVVRTRLNATYGGVYTLPAMRCAAMYDDKVAGNTASGVTTVN